MKMHPTSFAIIVLIDQLTNLQITLFEYRQADSKHQFSGLSDNGIHVTLYEHS